MRPTHCLPEQSEGKTKVMKQQHLPHQKHNYYFRAVIEQLFLIPSKSYFLYIFNLPIIYSPVKLIVCI